MRQNVERKPVHEIVAGDTIKSEHGVVLVQSWRWVVGNGLIVKGHAKADGSCTTLRFAPQDVVSLVAHGPRVSE